MHGCWGEHPSVALAREVGLGHLPKKLAGEDCGGSEKQGDKMY